MEAYILILTLALSGNTGNNNTALGGMSMGSFRLKNHVKWREMHG